MFTFKVDNREIQLEDLGNQDVSGRAFLGTASGRDIGHCIYMGIKYGKDFVDRVRAYKQVAPTEKDMPCAVSFYE